MTPQEHAAQRERVLLSSLLADTPEDRHGSYPKRVKPPVYLKPHVFVLPTVTPAEPKERLL